MKKLRIGNDISVRWKVKGAENFAKSDVRLELRHSLRSAVVVEDFSLQAGVVLFTYYGKDQDATGEYTLTLYHREGEHGMTTIDTCKAFFLVAHSCDSTSADYDVNIENEGATSSRGFSAYELAVMNGFQGTVEEWISSLQGEAFTYEDFTPEQLEALKLKFNHLTDEEREGLRGYSAYQLYLKSTLDNPPLTEEEYANNSLWGWDIVERLIKGEENE